MLLNLYKQKWNILKLYQTMLKVMKEIQNNNGIKSKIYSKNSLLVNKMIIIHNLAHAAKVMNNRVVIFQINQIMIFIMFHQLNF